jgi:hypothetical protein
VKKAYELYLAIKLRIRTTAGDHTHLAVDVHDIYMAGALALTSQCLLQSLECEENRTTILLIATFV